ncbi:aminotransferase-like domain-containing protein [Bordetella sp. 2513F-2]
MADWSPRLDTRGGTKYAAVVAAIEQGVADGALLPGTRLPPQRDIANYLNVTIATVTKAINIAMRKGLVTARAGSGTFIAARPVLDGGKGAAPGALDLSLNAPPVSVAASLLQENLKDVANAVDAAGGFDYEPVPGSLQHRAAGSAWFARRGYEVDPAQILITQGAHEGLVVSLLALTQPGDTVLCEKLNYTGLRRIGDLLRIKLVGVDVDGHGMDADILPGLISRHQAKAIVCTPATHNPTSVTMSPQRRMGLVSAARAAGVPIIEDDIYGLFLGNDPAPLATLWPEGVIAVTSLSKTIAPGLRLGYVAAPAELVSRVRDAILMLAWTEPLLQAAFATRLIMSGRAEQCVALHRNEAQRRVRLARDILGQSMQTSVDACTYHIWVSTGAMRADDMAAQLYREGVQVSPASHFVIGDLPAPYAMRLSLGRAASARALEEPLRLIADRLSLSHPVAVGSIV